MRRRKFDLELLRRLWPTSIPDKNLSDLFGVTRGNLHRRASRWGWPPRRVARAGQIEAIMKVARSGHDVEVGWTCDACGAMKPWTVAVCDCDQSRSESNKVKPELGTAGRS